MDEMMNVTSTAPATDYSVVMKEFAEPYANRSVWISELAERSGHSKHHIRRLLVILGFSRGKLSGPLPAEREFNLMVQQDDELRDLLLVLCSQ